MKKLTERQKLNKVLESYEKKGYIVDDTFLMDYEKELKQKMKKIKWQD